MQVLPCIVKKFFSVYNFVLNFGEALLAQMKLREEKVIITKLRWLQVDHKKLQD